MATETVQSTLPKPITEILYLAFELSQSNGSWASRLV